MRDEFDTLAAHRFKVLDDVPVPDVWSRVQLKLLDPTPFTEQGSAVIDFETPSRSGEHRNGRKWVVVALVAAAALLLVAGTVLVQRDPRKPAVVTTASVVPDTTAPASPVASVVPDTTAPASPVASVVPDTTVPAPVMNGWVALDSVESGGGDIYLVRSGEDARRLELAGSETADEACPAWSPDGSRLSFGRVTGSPDTALSDAELVIVPVGLDGAIGAPTVIALDGFHALDGFDAHPCAIWAPDGRWVAFGGSGDVWVVDTQTGAIRHLPNLRPSDLEWRPATDQLAIAGDMGTNRGAPTLSTPVTVYSVSTGELRELGSVEAAHLTWSPDGSTLAYTTGEDGSDELWLVDADGANERLLTHVGEANHGIGPMWSPTGDRIAYQRRLGGSGERHEVVVVGVADGNQTVIEPPETNGPNGLVTWYPFTVTWSPDGTALLYTAWSQSPGEPSESPNGVIVVPVDTPSDVTVLTDAIDPVPNYSHRWVPTQMWGRQPV